MDDVRRPQLEIDRCRDGNVQLVRADHLTAHVWVPVLPPPLMADHADAQRRDPVRRNGRADLAHRAEHENEDHREDAQGRGGPEDLEARVPVDLRGRAGRPRSAKAPRGIDERRFDADEDDERDGGDDPSERGDRLGRRSHDP